MDKIEEAKKLLKTALETDDVELVALANKILQQSNKKTEVEKPTQTVNRSVNTEDFVTPITKPDKMPTHKGSPVNDVNKRVNTFVDDGSEVSQSRRLNKFAGGVLRNTQFTQHTFENFLLATNA